MSHQEEELEEEVIDGQEVRDTDLAEQALEDIETHEQADLAQDLLSPHPHKVDTQDQSGRFRALMEQIDTAESEQERVRHYHDALHIFTNTWLGEQGLKI